MAQAVADLKFLHQDIIIRHPESREITVLDGMLEVGKANFQADVIDASLERPVVIDFWAPWCAPCRALSPVLDKLAREYADRLHFVKLNTDENPELAARFSIRGIPNVKAIAGGKVISEFTGVLPEAAIRRFLDKLIPSEAEKRLALARAALDSGQPEEAERWLRSALEMDSELHAARIELAGLLCNREAFEEAEQVYGLVPERARNEQANKVATLIEQWRVARALPPMAELEEACRNDPGDLGLRLKLGERHALERRHAEALQHLLDVVKRDRGEYRDAARKAMLRIFALSEDAALVGQFRRELASALN